jgi:hypothetical protein
MDNLQTKMLDRLEIHMINLIRRNILVDQGHMHPWLYLSWVLAARPQPLGGRRGGRAMAT